MKNTTIQKLLLALMTNAKKINWGKKNIPHFSKKSLNFQSKSWSNLLNSPYGPFSQVMEQFFGLLQAYLFNALYDWFLSKLILTNNHLLGNVA